jgi:hypothetical protein
MCVNFSMSAGPFKQTGLGGGHQAAVSHSLTGKGMGKICKR